MGEVCSLSVSSQTKYNGTLSSPIQINESSFCVKHKYNRGRLRNGDKTLRNERELSKLIEAQVPSKKYGVAYGFVTNRRKCNYRLKRICGQWVLGVYAVPTMIRFKVVSNRSAATLLPIINEWVEPNTAIVSDGWDTYINLEQNRYRHKAVIHKEEFMTKDGWHTRVIERGYWKVKDG